MTNMGCHQNEADLIGYHDGKVQMVDKPAMPALKDFRPFLGYGPENYVLAKGFYQDLGFKLLWESDDACEFDTRIGQRFLVTLHHGLERENAGMVSLWVESVDDWAAYLKELKLDKKYPQVKIAEPTITEWGWHILYVWDPGGYLLHIGEPHSDQNRQFFDQADWLAR